MTCVYDPPRRQCVDDVPPPAGDRWRGPEGYTLVSWEVDFRTGGASRVCLRSPSGEDRWVDGARIEIVEPERVVFSGGLPFGAGMPVTFRRVGL